MRAFLLAVFVTLSIAVADQGYRLLPGMWPIEPPVPSAWLIPEAGLRVEKRRDSPQLPGINHEDIELWIFGLGLGALPHVVALQ